MLNRFSRALVSYLLWPCFRIPSLMKPKSRLIKFGVIEQIITIRIYHDSCFQIVVIRKMIEAGCSLYDDDVNDVCMYATLYVPTESIEQVRRSKNSYHVQAKAISSVLLPRSRLPV